MTHEHTEPRHPASEVEWPAYASLSSILESVVPNLALISSYPRRTLRPPSCHEFHEFNRASRRRWLKTINNTLESIEWIWSGCSEEKEVILKTVTRCPFKISEVPTYRTIVLLLSPILNYLSLGTTSSTSSIVCALLLNNPSNGIGKRKECLTKRIHFFLLSIKSWGSLIVLQTESRSN
jgi:hypothetical protein